MPYYKLVMRACVRACVFGGVLLSVSLFGPKHPLSFDFL